MTAVPSVAPPVVECRALTKRFGTTTAVRDVSFTVEEGQIFGLLGPNGSGKTTTLSCALGLVRPTSGEARVLGRPARALHATRGRVGVVFDGANLLPGLGVRANLEYARRLLGHDGGRTIDEAMELVGLTELAHRRAGRLSLGEAKRVAVARALLGRPELLVLDEPLSALDPLGVTSMLALLRRLAGEGMTLLLSSHRLAEMEQVISHAGILANGVLVRSGSLTELLGTDGEVHRLRASPLERAERLCAEHPGVRDVRRERALDAKADGEASLELRVVLDGARIAALNRALVEADCEVSAIRREASDLPTLFTRLVAGTPAARVEEEDAA